VQDQTVCPYCEAVLSRHVLSCRSCGRDLTPVLPLLRRIEALECRLAGMEKAREERRFVPAAPNPDAPEAEAEPPAPRLGLIARRRYHALPVGFLLLLGAYAMVVLWLDLSLSVLRLASIAVPFGTGLVYFGIRPRLTWFDACIAIGFAIFSVAAMNALLGWIDNIPLLPQGPTAWRETFFYALSIGASMLSGMLLRVTQAALTARGLVSLPELRKGLLAVNGKLPVETIKTIETTILMVSTVISAIAGFIAVLLGVK
jgi:hypothetical protein